MKQVIFSLFLLFSFGLKAQLFSVTSQTVTTTNPDSCNAINVDVLTYLGCINYTQGPATYRVNGSNINIRVNYTSSPICAGAISNPLFQIQMMNVPGGTYTLNTGAFLDGVLVNSVSSPLTVTNCMVTNLEEAQLQSLKVYPNPVKETLYLEVPTHYSQNLEYKLFNLAGKEIEKGLIGQNSDYQIEVSTLKAGLYFIELSNQNERKVLKFSVL